MLWADGRYAVLRNDLHGQATGHAVLLAFFDAAGAPIGDDHLVAAIGGDGLTPRMTFTGSEFGVVFHPRITFGHYDLILARVAPTGELLEPLLPLTARPSVNVALGLAWTGAEYAVGWVEREGAERGARLRFVRCGCDDVEDLDGDGYGTCQGDCDDLDASLNPSAAETCNGTDDNCNGLVDEDARGDGLDDDDVGTLCDNCAANFNPSQTDGDGDGIGDLCEPDGGSIELHFVTGSRIEWTDTADFTEWNVHRGDLGVLRATCVYVQDPSTVDLARHDTGLESPSAVDAVFLSEGEAVFYLVTGSVDGVEGLLGTDSQGRARLAGGPCP